MTTGQGWTDGEGEAHVPTVRGFLLAERDDASFDVLTTDLFTRTWKRTPDDVPSLRRVAYRVLDLGVEVRTELAAIEARAKGGEGTREFMERRFGERLSERAARLGMAFACAENALGAEAHALLEAARGTGAFWNGETDEGPLRRDVYEEFATAVVWRHVEAFGEKEVSRPALLARFRDFLATFPESDHARTAREAVEILERMVAEDQAYAEAARPFEELTKAEQVADLIFRLRDQNGGQFGQPGSPSVFLSLSDPDNEDTPAHQLLAMGHEAVPQLIEVLTDTRFTRTVGYWRNFTYSHYVVRIGDAALDILERIARRSFWSGTYTAASMVKDGQQEATQARARAWWTELEEKGERQALMDDVQRMDGNSASAARVLLEKYPDDARDTILGLAKNREAGDMPLWLIQSLTHDVSGTTQAPILRHLLGEAPTLDGRLLAAWWLIKHGYDEAVPAMREEWKTVDTLPAWESMSVWNFANFFLYAGTVDAIHALADDFDEHPLQVRQWVLDHLNVASKRHERWPPLDAEAALLFEDFLAKALDDEAEVGGSQSAGGRSVDDVRIADLAAKALAAFWQDEQAFDFYALMHQRDRQIHALQDRWRTMRGREPLPDPAAVGVEPLPDEVVRALVRACQRAPSPEERGKAARALESHGLAALPGLRRAIALLEQRPVPELVETAHRLAFVVREARVKPDGATIAPAADVLLEWLRGRVLEPAHVAELADLAPQELPEGVQGIVLRVARDGDDRGVLVQVEVVPVPPDRTLRDGGWEERRRVKVGRRTLTNSSTWFDEHEPPGIDAGLAELIAEALQAPPGTPVGIRISLQRSLVTIHPGPLPLGEVVPPHDHR